MTLHASSGFTRIPHLTRSRLSQGDVRFVLHHSMSKALLPARPPNAPPPARRHPSSRARARAVEAATRRAASRAPSCERNRRAASFATPKCVPRAEYCWLLPGERPRRARWQAVRATRPRRRARVRAPLTRAPVCGASIASGFDCYSNNFWFQWPIQQFLVSIADATIYAQGAVRALLSARGRHAPVRYVVPRPERSGPGSPAAEPRPATLRGQ